MKKLLIGFQTFHHGEFRWEKPWPGSDSGKQKRKSEQEKLTKKYFSDVHGSIKIYCVKLQNFLIVMTLTRQRYVNILNFQI